MASYPPPTGDDPNYNANDFISADAAAAAGNYVLKTGDTMTGALTVPTLIATTVQTQTLDSTTVVEGDYYRILQPGSAVANTNPGQFSLLLNPKSTAASGNDVIQTGDQAILFTDGAANSGSLVMAPMTSSGVSSGMRMIGTGDVTMYNGLDVTGALHAASTLQVDGQSTFNSAVVAQGGSVGSWISPVLTYADPAFIDPSNPGAMLTSNSNAGSSNPLVQLGDSSLLFQGPTGQDSGSLVIGPSSGHIKGLIMRGADGVVEDQQKHVFYRSLAEGDEDNAEVANTGSNCIIINAKSQANASNPALQAGDACILFAHDGQANSVDLHIGPYSTGMSKAGMRVTKNGELQCYGPITSAQTISSQATSSQIVLGLTNTVTINSVAPALSRIYTMPDAGANASFVMSEGNSTINGTKTFGSNLLISNPTSNILLAGTATQQTGAKYTFSCDNNSGSRLYVGDGSVVTKSARGYMTVGTSVDSGTVNNTNVDPGDNVRIINLRNQFSEATGSANRGIGMSWELWPSASLVNTARVYNDLTVKREASNSSSGSWNFGGFNSAFSAYNTYHRLCQGTSVPSFLCSQGTDNTLANQPGLSIFTQDTPGGTTPTAKLMIGANSQSAVTGGFQYGNQFDMTLMGGCYMNNNKLTLSRGLLVGTTVASYLATVTLTINIASTSATASAMLVKITAIGSHQAASTTVDTDTRTQQLDSVVQLQWINGVLGANVVTNTTTYFDALLSRNIAVAVVNPTSSTGTSAVITTNFTSTGGTSSNQIRGSISYEIIMDTKNMVTSYAFS